MSRSCFVVVLLLIVKSSESEVRNVEPIVDTIYGKIQGTILKRRQEPNFEYYAFKGIPYAKPPIGDLRFQVASAPNHWGDNIKNCTDFGPKCTQYIYEDESVTGHEDCLTLNIFTRNLNVSQPVMLFLHGGNYYWGSGSDHGADFLVEKPIVLVTINYRLDIFGFLTTMDSNAFGNFGLKDQIAALEWVKENIGNFGGDPDKVTVFGQSAGANSLSLLRFSDRAKGLYKQVIGESCSALSHRHLQRDPLKYLHNVAKYFNISVDDNKSIVEGLRKIAAETLIRAANNPNITGFDVNFGPFPFYPVIESPNPGAILTSSPYLLLESGNFSKIPYIAGYNTQEGTTGLRLIERFGLNIEDFDKNPALFYSPSFNNDENRKRIGKYIRDFFLRNDSAKCTEEFLQFLTQDMYVRAIRKEWDFLAKYSSNQGYFYKFSYKGAMSTKYPGTAHGEELNYLLPKNEISDNLDDENDIITSRRIVELWTNFAIYGNPTPGNSSLLQNAKWPHSSEEKIRVLKIDKDLIIEEDPDELYYEFYKSAFEKFAIPPFITY